MLSKRFLGSTLALFSVSVSVAAEGAALDSFTRGGLSAGLDRCMQVDRADSDKFQRTRKVVMAGLSEDAVEALQRDADYQKGYAAFGAAVGGIAPDAARQQCQAAAAQVK